MKRISFGITLLFVSLVGCVYHDTQSFVDCTSSNLSVAIDTVIQSTGCSAADGAIHVTVTGGELPYTFVVNGEWPASEEINGLNAGIYTVKVRDANGCERELHNVAVVAEGFAFETILTEDTDCLGGNGGVTLRITEGNKPYQYRIDGGTFQGDSVFTSLEQGEHVMEVKDAGNCVSKLTIEIPRGKSNVSWSNDIKPLLTTYCASSGCHNGISRTTDFRKYNMAYQYRAEIKSRTQDRSMPFNGPGLTQDQINVIACWVDDGGEEN